MQKMNSESVSKYIFAITKAFFWGLGIPYMLKIAKTSSLWSAVLGFILSLIVLSIFLCLMNTNTDKNITEKINHAFPKIIAYPLHFIIILISLTFVMILLWKVIGFVSIEFLTETPLLFIGLIILSNLIYSTSKNLESLSRFCYIAFVICLLILAFNFTGLIPSVKIDNLKPFFNESFMNILEGAIHYAVYFSAPLFFITIIKKDNIIDKEKFNKKMIIYYILSFLIIMTVLFFIISTLGIDVAMLFKFPAYIALKKIDLIYFIQHVENLSSMVWIFYIFITCALISLFIKNYIITLFKLPKKKSNTLLSFIIPTIPLLTSLFFVQKDYYITDEFFFNFPFYTNLAIIIIMFIILIFSKAKRRN